MKPAKVTKAMKAVLACLSAGLAACATGQAPAPAQARIQAQAQAQPQQPQQEALFVARVERITLAPRGGMACPELCPSTFSPNVDGSTHVCVANDGGCQKTEVRVERVLLGTLQPGPYTFDARIGEWNDVHFPMTHGPILVHVRQGLIEWAPVTGKAGREQVRLKAFGFGVVAGVDLSTLANGGGDGNGDGDAVALDAVARRLATAPR